MATPATAQTFGTLVAAELNKAAKELPIRCPHDVYIPESDRATGKAPYCTGCYQGGPPFKTRMIVLPSAHNRDLDPSTLGHANKRRPDCCPECGSPIHEELSASLWACSECSTKFRAPKRRRNVG